MIWTAFRGNGARTGLTAGVTFSAPPDLAWARPLGEGILASPVVAGNRVYVAGKDGLVSCFDQGGETPDGAWPVRVAGSIAATPLLFGGRLYVATLGGELFAFNAATGDLEGHVADLGRIDASLAAAEESGLVIAVTQQGEACGFDRDLGVRWRFPDRGERPVGGGFRASPAVAEGVLCAVSEPGEVVVLDQAGGHVRERWRAWASGEVLATPLIVRGFLCVLTKAAELTTYRLGDGRIHARGTCHGAGYVVASPALASADRGLLVFGAADGRIHGIDYLSGRPETGFPVDPGFPAPEPMVSSPACAGGLAILGSDAGHVLAIDVTGAKVAWSLALGTPVRSSPALDADRLYVCAEDGTLYAFAPGSVPTR
jgi:outer membrane protein assembly factor BamB